MHTSCSGKFKTTCTQAVPENFKQHAHKLFQKIENNMHTSCSGKFKTTCTQAVPQNLKQHAHKLFQKI